MTDTITLPRAVVQMVLEALKFGLHVGFDESSESQIKKGGKAFDQHSKAITALREALEQPQKAIAWGMPGKNWEILDVISPEEHDREEGGYTVPLFAAPLYGNRIELLDAVREEAALICLDYHRAGGTAWDCWNALRKREENGKD